MLPRMQRYVDLYKDRAIKVRAVSTAKGDLEHCEAPKEIGTVCNLLFAEGEDL